MENKLYEEILNETEKLTESDDGYGFLNTQFDETFAMTDAAKDYEAGSLDDAIEAAKKGDDGAELFLLSKSKKMIFHVFWNNFIGKSAPKKVTKMRLANNEFGDFLSLVYIAFEKAIKAFDPKKYTDIKIGNFQYYLGRYLKAEAISWNKKEKDDPTGGSIHPDGMDAETESKGAGNGNAWNSLVGGSEDESNLDFIEDWKDFCKDPRMNEPLSKKVSASRKSILSKLLQGKSIPQLADELGVTKATAYSNINFGDILKDYNIDQSQMAKVLAVDPDAILNPLKD